MRKPHLLRSFEIYGRHSYLVRLIDDALRAAGADLSAFEEPEVSGIAGTSLSAVFSPYG